MAGYYAEEADLRDKLDKVVDHIDRNATGTEIV